MRKTGLLKKALALALSVTMIASTGGAGVLADEITFNEGQDLSVEENVSFDNEEGNTATDESYFAYEEENNDLSWGSDEVIEDELNDAGYASDDIAYDEEGFVDDEGTVSSDEEIVASEDLTYATDELIIEEDLNDEANAFDEAGFQPAQTPEESEAAVAFRNAVEGNTGASTVTLGEDITLTTARIEVDRDVTVDLGGHTIYPTSACGNGSAFNIRQGGKLTLKNGTISGSKVVEEDGSTSAGYVGKDDGIRLITVVQGGSLYIISDDVTMTINSKNGCCVYSFDGGKIVISGGTYINSTTEQYEYNSSMKGMLINQANLNPQMIEITGGKYQGQDPSNVVDASGTPVSFLKEGYMSVKKSTYWEIVKAGASRTVSDAPVYYQTFAEAADDRENTNDVVTLLDNASAAYTLEYLASPLIVKKGTYTLTVNAESGYMLKDPTTDSQTGVTTYELVKAYTITYVLNGGKVATANPTTYSKSSADITLNNPTKTGFDFAGWTGTDLAAATKTVKIASGSTGDRTYTATWTPAKYTVQLLLEGGKLPETEKYPKEYTIETADFTLPTPTKEGYEFAGWTGEGVTTPNKNVTIKKGSSGNKVYGASWTTATYTVTFDSDGGSTVAAQKVESGKKATKPTDPTKKGYTFDKWMLGEKEFDFSTKITEDITLKAKYKTASCKVTFDSDGGSTVAAQTVEYNKKATKPTDPTKTGYTFDKWMNGTKAFDFDTAITEDITLKASWIENEYTVKFDSDGGSSVASQKVKYNGTATKPTNPTKKGYVFDKWTLNGKAYDFSTKVTSDITLKANWKGNTFTVDFDSDGGSTVNSQIVESGKTAQKPTDPKKTDGSVFVGWFDGDEEFNFSTPITANKTLTAHWEKTIYNKDKLVIKDDSDSAIQLRDVDTSVKQAVLNTFATELKNIPSTEQLTITIDFEGEKIETADGSVTFSVHPVATITRANGTVVVDKEIISNTQLVRQDAEFTFRLYLTPGDFTVGEVVKVDHESDAYSTSKFSETFYLEVEGTSAKPYVTVTINRFSTLTVSSVDTVAIPVTMDGGVASVTIKGTGKYTFTEVVTTNSYIYPPVGAKLTITVTPMTGYTATVKPTTATAAKGVTIVATSESTDTGSYRLSLIRGTGGAADPTCNKSTSVYYPSGTSMTVTAGAASDGYEFDGWYKGTTKVSSSVSYSFYLNANTTLTAAYNKILTITAPNETVSYGVEYKADATKCTVSGLKTGDTEANIVDRTNLKVTVPSTYSKTAAIGSVFTLTASGAALKTGVTGYVIKYASGTLTVTSGSEVDKFLADVSTLPTTAEATIYDRAIVDNAKTDYLALGEEQKKLPSVIAAKAKLDAVDAAVKAAEDKVAADKAAGEAVAAKIAALPATIAVTDKDDVEAARKAYDALTPAQKDYVPLASVIALEAAEDALEKAEKAAADKEKADAVKALIDALPSPITLDDKDAIDAARAAYDALTSDQKALIPESLTALEAAEKAYEAAKKAADQEVAERFTAAVNAVPGNVAGEGKALVDEATAIYETLTRAQWDLIEQKTFTLYEEEVEAFRKNRTFISGSNWYKVLSNGDVTYLRPDSRDIENITVPNEVRKGQFYFKVIKVSNNAFRNCKNLKWAILSSNIRVLGQYAFARTESLINVRVMSPDVVSGKCPETFYKAGKNRYLKVKVPSEKFDEYEELFFDEARLNGVVIAY